MCGNTGGVRSLSSCRQGNGINDSTFVGVNRRKEQLEYTTLLVHATSGSGLRPADDPIAVLFGILECVEMSGENIDIVVTKDDLNTCIGTTFAAMYDSSAQLLVKYKIPIV